MKKILLAAAAIGALPAFGQISPSGLIAHWGFTGNVLDSSCNAYNGAATAVTYTTGRNGHPNSAALLNAPTSYISVSYAFTTIR